MPRRILSGYAALWKGYEVPENYPWGLVRQLMDGWEKLAEGRWPANARLPEGYRGQKYRHAPYEAAIVAKADIERAIGQVPGARERGQIVDWLRGRKEHATPVWMVDLVWERVNE